MDRLAAVLVIAVFVVLVFTGLAFGWRARRRRQAGLPVLTAPPQALGGALFAADGFYVATTRADAPTDRIAVRGLAFRGRAGVTVHPDGVVLSIAGQPDAFIPKSAVVGVGAATWTIDRVVGKDGLVFVRWTFGDVEVDTNLKVADPGALLAALATLTPVSKEAA